MAQGDRVTLQQLEERYNVPLIDVANELGMSMTMLKQTCRGLGIKRWPHRLIRSIDRSIAQLQVKLDAPGQTDSARLRVKLYELIERRQRAIVETSTALPTSDQARRAKLLHARPPTAVTGPRPYAPRVQPRRTSARRTRSSSRLVEADEDAPVTPRPSLLLEDWSTPAAAGAGTAESVPEDDPWDAQPWVRKQMAAMMAASYPPLPLNAPHTQTLSQRQPQQYVPMTTASAAASVFSVCV
ncbi:RWP-RK domain-containing protein [Tribonema minus]|uniref:RWP-RK domain-containing protein n=1 Tax=Tribonema minus TaxID=303371 RepID=A0A836CCL1_9STRA|nr:RWP-RK domain-containing protein [Tribonema minus]